MRIDVVYFRDVLMDGDYTEFSLCYLIREMKGDTMFIQGKLWLSRYLSGHPTTPVNRRAKGIADDEDPDSERIAQGLAPKDGGDDKSEESKEIPSNETGRGAGIGA